MTIMRVELVLISAMLLVSLILLGRLRERVRMLEKIVEKVLTCR